MGVNSLPKTRQRRGCDLNPGPSAPESSTLTTRLQSHPDWTCSIGRVVVLIARSVAASPSAGDSVSVRLQAGCCNAAAAAVRPPDHPHAFPQHQNRRQKTAHTACQGQVCDLIHPLEFCRNVHPTARSPRLKFSPASSAI